MTGDRTVSIRDDAGSHREIEDRESLVLVLDAARPLDDPWSVPLAEVDEVVLGRGAARAVAPTRARAVRVELDDASVSTRHAVLVRSTPGWTLLDERSRNGTLVNGERVSKAHAGGDDLVELGNCFFVLRRAVPALADAPRALRTLNAGYAERLADLPRIARSTLPLLFLGETGTGKEVLARAAHELSGRGGPFVAVNCGAIPQTLVESELFGARRGAYSGAAADRAGTVAAADRGTLFLDEIAELPETSQAALLRTLQEGEVQPLGAARPVKVDVRVIAATHQDLARRIAAGSFRDDLYARLRGEIVVLPPLRKRREDLGLLCADLLRRAAGERAAAIKLQREAARALLLHAWPHNVRELERVLTRAVSLLDGDVIQLRHLPPDLVAARESPPPEVVGEKARLIHLLNVHRGNLSAVARALATSRSQVRRLIERHGIRLED